MNQDLNLLLHPETSCFLLLSKFFYQMSISDQIFPSRNLKISTVWKETLGRECQNLRITYFKILTFFIFVFYFFGGVILLSCVIADITLSLPLISIFPLDCSVSFVSVFLERNLWVSNLIKIYAEDRGETEQGTSVEIKSSQPARLLRNAW